MSAQHPHFQEPLYGPRQPPALTPMKQPVITNTKSSATTYAQFQLGLSISKQKTRAIEECKATVERIAARCRRKNRKFR